MEERLCSFETSIIAKEKDFDIAVNDYSNIVEPEIVVTVAKFNHNYKAHGNTVVSRPRQTLLQKWLREKHFLEVLVTCNGSGWFYEINKAYFTGSLSGGTSVSWSKDSGPNDSGEWETYEDALEEGLKEGLKLI